MVLTVLNKCVIILFILKCCRSSENPGKGENIMKLYELIAGAIKDDLNKPHISRRVINESVYKIHINKLKDVNGFKMHNIVINRTDTNSTIYINNPLESKLPHPFMTLEEFKKAIAEQPLKDREAFLRSKKVEDDRKKWAKIKATAKLKSKHTFPKQTYTEAMSSKKTESIGTKLSLTKKLNNYKRDNELKTVTNMYTTTTKGKQNAKEHVNMVKEKGTVENLSSSTSNLKQKTTLSAKLSTAYSSAKLLRYDQHFPTEHVSVTRKTVTNIGVSEQNITTVFEDKSKTINESETTTTAEEKIADKEGKESTTAEEHQASTVDEIDPTDSNETEPTAPDGESTTIETKSTVSDKDQLTTVDEQETTNVDEGENTADSEETEETSTESSTTTTTLPTTTRERWSRPRVFMGSRPDGTSTSSLILE